MKKNHLNRFAGIHTAIATVLALSSASQAQSLYWDPTGTAAGFGNFTGAWNGTNTLWNTDATGGAGGSLTATTAGANLFVPGAGPTGVLNLTGAQSAATLDFNNTGNLAAFQLSDGGSLSLSGALTDTGAGNADIRIVNTSQANAATKLVASSVTMGVITVENASGGNTNYFTTGYDITIATQYSIGSSAGNTIIRQTAGTVQVNNPADRGFVMTSSGSFANSSLYTTSYVLDGGIMRANRIGMGLFNANNNANNSWGTSARLEFNDGILSSFNNGTLFLQNGLAFNTYTGSETKDTQYDTNKPYTVELSQTGTHSFEAAGTGAIIVTPSARLIDKTGEAGTLTKTGTGTLVFTGDNALAVNSYTGSTTVNAGTVSTDYNRIAGSAATGGTDNLSNGYNAASDLVLDGGNYSLVGRGSADAGSANVTLNANFAGQTVTLASTTGLVIGQSVTNANLPTGTYIRRILNGTQIELNAMSTSTASQADQTLDFGAASFNNTQTVDDVAVSQNATVTVTPGAGTSTTLLSFGNMTGSGGLTKAGTGKLELTGNLAHTGTVNISAGTLEYALSSNFATSAAVNGAGTLVKSGSGILTFNNNTPSRHGHTGAVIINGGTLANGGGANGLLNSSSFTVNSGGILLVNPDGLGYGAAKPITINAGGTMRGGVQGLGSLTLNGGLLDGTGSYLGVNFALNQDVTVGGSSASIIQGNAGIALNGYDVAAGGTRTFNVADATGDANADLTISTVVRNAYGPSSNLTNLQKTGAGTMVLSGVNTYTGETIVLEGTLAVNGTSLADTNSLTIDGGTVDLTNVETVSALFFGAAPQTPGIWGSSSSAAVAPFVDDTRFSGTGTLNVVPVSGTGYADWQTANGTAQAANLDHDNDGVSNGVEHFLGGIADTTGNSNPLPSVIDNAGTLSITWVRDSGFSGFPANYGTGVIVETSATLSDPWTPAIEGVGAGFVQISGDNVTYTFPAGTKNFARLKVVTTP